MTPISTKHKFSIITTSDGSQTILNETTQDTYHSRNGAIQESEHVFLKNGLAYYVEMYSKQKIRILEFGLGTGLNVLLSYHWLSNNQVDLTLDYHAVEKFPISAEISSQLSYKEVPNDNILLEKIHDCKDSQTICLSENFQFRMYEQDFEKFNSNEKFDIIFHDAFSPSTHPSVWQEAFLLKCYNLLNDNGILITYCAQGAFKRALKAVGFTVEKLAGPPGKREITRATH